MARFYVHLILIPFALFSALLLLIHAQPYNDHGLHQLLVPDGCPAPCFMGIRPDVTTEDEVLPLISANTWVADAQKYISVTYDVVWRWRQGTPEYLESISPPASFGLRSELGVTKLWVSSISYSTRYTLGDVVLAWGLPSTSLLTLLNPSGAASLSIPANIALDYQQEGFIATIFLSCPYTADLWHTPVRITLAGNLRTISIAPIMTIERRFFLPAIRRSSNRACG